MHGASSWSRVGSLCALTLAGCPQPEALPDAASDRDAIVLEDAAGSIDAASSDDAAPGTDAPDRRDAPVLTMDAGGALLDDALHAAGFEVRPAQLRAVDLADCCAEGRSCSGNNPSSPYLTVRVGRGPAQTEPNPGEAADGLSEQFFLRGDEAILLFGTTPPPARYFGFTPYLMSRLQMSGERAPIFASLSETLNDDVIETEGGTAFDARTAIVLAADRRTAEDARAALEAAGHAAVNIVTFDPAMTRFGLDSSADALGVLVRVAFPESPARADEWLAMPRMSALRISRTAPGAFDPLPTPPARPKDPDARELRLTSALDRLEAAIRAAHSRDTIRDLTVTDGALDPAACITTPRFCAGDNRDTVYPATGAFFLGRGDSLWIFGVDHDATDKATYHSCALYALDHLVGLRAVSSLEWAGSAERFLPGDPEAGSLFAWRFSRDCAGDAYCTEVPVGTCPDGAPITGALAIAFRAYVEPTTSTAPDPATLVRERAMLIR